MIDFHLFESVRFVAQFKGVTFKDLCKKVGITESGLSYSLKNNTIKLDTLKSIADVLNVPVSIFIDEVGKEAGLIYELGEELRKSNAMLGKLHELFKELDGTIDKKTVDPLIKDAAKKIEKRWEDYRKDVQMKGGIVNEADSEGLPESMSGIEKKTDKRLRDSHKTMLYYSDYQTSHNLKETAKLINTIIESNKEQKKK